MCLFCRLSVRVVLLAVNCDWLFYPLYTTYKTGLALSDFLCDLRVFLPLYFSWCKTGKLGTIVAERSDW